MGIGNTRVEEQLKKAMQLNDAIAWFEAHTPEVKTMVVELIKYAQLKNKGVDKFNEIIGTYSQTTELINPQKVAGTPYTLEDTGVFYRSMMVVVLKDSILIDATTAHMENETWWSINILGLNEQNLAIYTEKIRQNFIAYARKYLGIN